MPDDCLELKESIEKEIGFALTFEGIHKWIAFIHSKQNNILPVPNRYFGVYKFLKRYLKYQIQDIDKIFSKVSLLDKDAKTKIRTLST